MLIGTDQSTIMVHLKKIKRGNLVWVPNQGSVSVNSYAKSNYHRKIYTNFNFGVFQGVVIRQVSTTQNSKIVIINTKLRASKRDRKLVHLPLSTNLPGFK